MEGRLVSLSFPLGQGKGDKQHYKRHEYVNLMIGSEYVTKAT